MHAALQLPDGRQLAFSAMPLIMGIVNVTPDSFSDGGLFLAPEAAIAQGRQLAAEGAAILDIGGESTRPGHQPLDAATELARVMPVIAGLAAGPVPLSIDTYKAEVARAAIAAGAQIINDVWGCHRDPAIAQVAAETGAPIILMHNRDKADPALDILDEVRRFLDAAVATARAAGVPESQIVLDPGVGFGKTAEQSIAVMRHLDRIVALGFPVLLGASRKSMLGLLTGQEVAANRVAASIAAHLAGALKGAAIIRVHDVRPHADALKVWSATGAAS